MELNEPILAVDELYRFYHPGEVEIRALRGASLRVDAGETVALMGPSGSGKSTLLACAAGLDAPDGGSVTIAGRRVTRRPEGERAAIRARSVGLVAQSGNLFGHLSLAENIRFQQALARRQAARTVEELLDLVGLSDRGDALPGTLSGGELARGALAVALAVDPPLLLADEPTAEVDAETERRILTIIEDRRARGGAALIATHSPAIGAGATRVLRIVDGIVSPGQTLRPSVPAASAGVRHPVSEGGARRFSNAAVFVSALGVTRLYPAAGETVRALAAASFVVRAGDRIAIMGPSGGGKTTLLDLMGGMAHATAGTISWPALGRREALRPSMIGMVFQSPSLLPALSVLENVRLPLGIADTETGRSMSPEEALDALGIGDLAGKLPDALSGGQMQRVGVARALVTRPKLILADEPTGQLDQATGQKLMDDLLATLDGTDAALVVATHDPAVAGRLGRVWRMDKGVLQTDLEGISRCLPFG